MPDARTIISGDPGTTWTNNTAKPMYQLVCGLMNTCGICYQYHLKIARLWPVPLHFGCRCRIQVVKMGQTAPHPFCDYQKLILGLDAPEQVKVMGAGNFKLWQAGVVPWDKIVTPSRIRPLHQVVALEKLSIKAMTKVGIPSSIAERAHGAVHTPEHEAVAAHRKELLQKIAGAGVAHDLVVRHLAEGIAGRVIIAPGPTYTTRAGVILPGITGGGIASPAETRAKQAAELKDVLSTAAGIKKAVAAMRKKSAKKPKPPRPAGETTSPTPPVAQPSPPTPEPKLTINPPNPPRSPRSGGTKAKAAPVVPGSFETIEHVREWARAAFPNFKAHVFDGGGIPIRVWNQIAPELERLARDFPGVARRLEYLNDPSINWNDPHYARAAAVGDNKAGRHLSFNPRYFSKPDAELREDRRLAAESGWMAGGFEADAVATHEWGHLVESWLYDTDPRRRAALLAAFRTGGAFDAAKAATISAYGATNETEAFAEAFVATRRLPSADRPAIVREFAGILGGGHKP
jgi:hypothetical protein